MENTMAITSSVNDAGSMNYSRQDVALALSLGKLKSSLMLAGVITNYSELARQQGSRMAGKVRITEVGKHTVKNKVAQTKATPSQVALTKEDIDIDQHKYVDFVVESAAALVVGNEKMTLSRTTENAILDLAEAIEAHVFSKYTNAGTTLTVSAAGKDLLRTVRKTVVQKKFNFALPTYGFWGAEAESGFLNVDAFTKVNEAGTNEALRNAAIGRIFGINNFTHNATPTIAGSPSREVELVLQADGMGIAFVPMDSADLPAEFKENGALASALTLEDDFGNAVYSMRLVSQYSQDWMGARVQIDTMFGADVVRDDLVIAVLLAI